MIYATSDSFFTIWRGEFKEKYAEFSLSTSRKDKRSGEYKNSNWSYVRFVGKAFDKIQTAKERDRITNVTFALDAEPYLNRDGQKVFPKYPHMVIFDFEFANKTAHDGVRGPSSKPYADPDPDDYDEDESDLPF